MNVMRFLTRNNATSETRTGTLEACRAPTRRGTLCLVAGLLVSLPLSAQQASPERDIHRQVFTTTYSAASSISGSALRGVSGAVNVNLASGDHNLQSNSGAIAVGANALANNIVVQQVKANNGLTPDQASVEIRDSALNHAIGWISVNQAAGSRNVQSNTMSVALGVRGSSLTSENLSQVLSGGSGQERDSDDSRSSRRDVGVGSSTFRGASGVIQVNQSAGRGNATSNSFSFRMGRD
ncbi:hypothetical protein ACOJCM_05015 [Billgrantia sp. LNSP4103-1]|uniref:hypothetical protein n=1 Tax=Billgrantia sp. LNSP4103-1 TaxID=3410266 RepID=UPI00403F5F47